MKREQVVAELRRHPVAHIARVSGASVGSVNKYLDGKAVHPSIEARLESYAYEFKRLLPSILGDDTARREQVVAELRRHPIGHVARESGVSSPTVHKYLNGEAVRPYIEARLEDFAREVAK